MPGCEFSLRAPHWSGWWCVGGYSDPVHPNRATGRRSAAVGLCLLRALQRPDRGWYRLHSDPESPVLETTIPPCASPGIRVFLFLVSYEPAVACPDRARPPWRNLLAHWVWLEPVKKSGKYRIRKKPSKTWPVSTPNSHYLDRGP